MYSQAEVVAGGAKCFARAYNIGGASSTTTGKLVAVKSTVLRGRGQLGRSLESGNGHGPGPRLEYDNGLRSMPWWARGFVHRYGIG